ncbi:MAG: hypothetical protein KY475_10160 [Planctomycetes bacterium]|nr:hypothetical protein [Planctomycetota bacterium]
MRASAKARAAIADVRAAGFPVTPDEWDDYYSLPDGAEINAAPLWISAMESLASDEYRDAEEALQIDVPVEWANFPPGRHWPRERAARAHLARYVQAVGALHEAAQVGSPCRYPIELQRGMHADYSHCHRMRLAARLLQLDAFMAARRGDAHRVAKSLHAIFALARSLEREPSPISQLLRITVAGYGLEVVPLALSHISFSNQDLSRLQTELEAADYLAGLRLGLIGERVLGIAAIQQPEQAGDESGRSMPLTYTLGRKADLALYLECMERYLAAAGKPWNEVSETREAVKQMVDSAVSGSASGESRTR